MTERTWEVIRGVLVLVVSTAVISSAISLYRLAQDHAPVVFTAGAEQRPLETHTWDQNTDNSPKQMLKTSEGICFLASVSGDFNGPGEEHFCRAGGWGVGLSWKSWNPARLRAQRHRALLALPVGALMCWPPSAAVFVEPRS